MVAAVLVAVARQGVGEVMQRILRQLSFPQWRVRRAFPGAVRQAIAAAVANAEQQHAGELRFVVEGRLDWMHLLRGITARQRAVELFSQLRIWDTEQNSGVLIYLQLADRRVEILADRGIHRRVGDQTWQRICREMEQAFHNGKFAEGAVNGVTAVGKVLAEHFPLAGENPDELPNAPVLL